MAAVSSGRNAMDQQTETQNGTAPSDRFKRLYPAVNEEKTELPRTWSTKNKYTYIGLSQNNLRVHYKGKSIIICPIVYVLRSLPSLDLFVREETIRLEDERGISKGSQ